MTCSFGAARKYRDEKRPREGLFRGREFLMKDLYTFDWNEAKAQESYENVKKAYSAFFGDLKFRHLVAEATSGNIGGNQSHEYHLLSSKGEDDVVSCDSCDYVANEEIAKRDDGFPSHIISVPVGLMESLAQSVEQTYQSKLPLRKFLALTQSHGDLLQIILPPRHDSEETTFNRHVMKELYPNIVLGTEHGSPSRKSSVSDLFTSTSTIKDRRVIYVMDRKISCDGFDPEHVTINGRSYPATVFKPGLDLVRLTAGDKCPNGACAGKLKIQKCVEIGHTFHLGTRYTTPLGATVSGPTASHSAHGAPPAEADDSSKQGRIIHNDAKLPMQMGCHGIGISRLIAAAANILQDAKGLNWPRAMAPFEAVIVPTLGREPEAGQVYDMLTDGETPLDCVIDDRPANFASKMKDADMIGYPIIVVVGKGWKAEPQSCQVQCRRLGSFAQDVALKDMKAKVDELLDQL
ncbi:MAG: hypothetical protein Q9163_003495 [Psora crenata]